jgi:hypothetical protein
VLSRMVAADALMQATRQRRRQTLERFVKHEQTPPRQRHQRATAVAIIRSSPSTCYRHPGLRSRRLRMASSTRASASLAFRASASAIWARSSVVVNLSFWASIHDCACSRALHAPCARSAASARSSASRNLSKALAGRRDLRLSVPDILRASRVGSRRGSGFE